jgi:predicted dinucleotide-binding enzyme
MRIGILGTGTMAAALAEAWQRAGHQIAVTGRSAEKAKSIADKLGSQVAVVDTDDLARQRDVIVIAVAWEGMREALELIGASTGKLSGLPIIDCTNPIDWETGASKLSVGSAVEYVAEVCGSNAVVKALHLYAGQGWLAEAPVRPRVVAMCGDNANALEVASTLVSDLGGTPVVVGGLDCGSQLEGVAGFVTRLVRNGVDPTTAVPAVPAQ